MVPKYSLIADEDYIALNYTYEDLDLSILLKLYSQTRLGTIVLEGTDEMFNMITIVPPINKIKMSICELIYIALSSCILTVSNVVDVEDGPIMVEYFTEFRKEFYARDEIIQKHRDGEFKFQDLRNSDQN